MLAFQDVVLRRGPRILLEAFSLQLHAGQRLGIVGRNGSGKSSLFAMIQGELPPDNGELHLGKGLAIAHVRQETPGLKDSALEFVLQGDAEFVALERELALAQEEAPEKLAAMHERMHAIDGYSARSRASQLLHGLGFADSDYARPVSDFSGGWRMRLNLAQALMCRSDLLLLDEPTNHLDLDAVIWLQAWLIRYRGILMVISHDRDFLDAVCSHTLYLDNGRAQLFTGNYSSSERQKAEALAQQSAAYKRQQQERAHLQKFVDRFRAKATKARQAQSRIKRLERMDVIGPVQESPGFSFAFAQPKRLPSPLLRWGRVELAYEPAQPVLANLRLQLEPGDRIGVLGRNGAGKSTLMKSLAGVMATHAGESHRDPYLRVGYFAQHQVDILDHARSPMAHMQALDEEASEQSLRDFLGGFAFVGDRVFESIAPFSGGEKARLALAMIVYQQPNLLLLDEPTNHLDLDMRHALEVALQAFSGAVVLVSHDRHLLASCVDQLWWVHDGLCTDFDGDLDDYAQRLRELESQISEVDAASPEPTRVSAKQQRQIAAQKRAELKPLRDKLKACEKGMARLEKRLDELNERLADADIYQSQPEQAATLAKEQGQLQKELEELEADWLSCAEELEEAQA